MHQEARFVPFLIHRRGEYFGRRFRLIWEGIWEGLGRLYVPRYLGGSGKAISSTCQNAPGGSFRTLSDTS